VGGENALFYQHAWGYLAKKNSSMCGNGRTLPLVEKICDRMGFWAANSIQIGTSEPQAVFLCSLDFVL